MLRRIVLLVLLCTQFATAQEWDVAPDADLQSETCNIERVTELSHEDFVEEFIQKKRPVILAGAAVEWSQDAQWDRTVLQQAHGQVLVQVQSANKAMPRNVTLTEFLKELDAMHGEDSLNTFDFSFLLDAPLLANYTLPLYFRHIRSPKFAFSVSPAGSSVDVPWPHGQMWHALVRGSVRWFLFSVDQDIKPAAGLSGRQWLRKVYPTLQTPAMECVQRAGDILYLPSGWSHMSVATTRFSVGFAGMEPLTARDTKALSMASTVAKLRRQAKNNPKSHTHMLKLAQALRESDRLEEAKEAYNATLRIKPSSGTALFGLGQVLADQLRHSAAAPYIVKAYELSYRPKAPEEQMLMASALVQQERFTEAEKLLTTLLRKDMDNFSVVKALALLYVKVKKEKLAIPLLKAVLDQEPDNNEVLYALGLCYKNTGKPDAASKILALVVDHDPDHYDAIFALAHTMGFQLRQPVEAAHLLTLAQQLRPDDEMPSNVIALLMKHFPKSFAEVHATNDKSDTDLDELPRANTDRLDNEEL